MSGFCPLTGDCGIRSRTSVILTVIQTKQKLSESLSALPVLAVPIPNVVRWYDRRIGNGILEGLNSLAQVAKAKARGHKTFRNFKAMIYLLAGTLDCTQTGLPT